MADYPGDRDAASHFISIPAKILANTTVRSDSVPAQSKPKQKAKAKFRRNLKRQRSATNVNYDESAPFDSDDEIIGISSKPEKEREKEKEKPKAEKTTMKMSAKCETPREFWDVLTRFWETPDQSFSETLIKAEDTHATMAMPALGKHYSERWEDAEDEPERGKHLSSVELKQPEGFGQELRQMDGYHGLQSLAVQHHTVAQRLLGAFVQTPGIPFEKLRKNEKPSEGIPIQETLTHARSMSDQGPTNDWNEVLMNELTYTGLLDEADDVRLRAKDCEDNVISQHVRAAQESLKAVRKRLHGSRAGLQASLQKHQPKLEEKARIETLDRRLEQQYMRGKKEGLTEWRTQARQR